VLGTPSEEDIELCGPDVQLYLRKLPARAPAPLADRFKGASPEALDLLSRVRDTLRGTHATVGRSTPPPPLIPAHRRAQFLAFNPAARIDVEAAIAHPYLAPVRALDPTHRRESVPPPVGVVGHIGEGEGSLEGLRALVVGEIRAFQLQMAHQAQAQAAATAAGTAAAASGSGKGAR
jgi:hypothetical protein